MLTRIRTVLLPHRRTTACRGAGHTWTDRADPPACSVCGVSRPPQAPDETQLAA